MRTYTFHKVKAVKRSQHNYEYEPSKVTPILAMAPVIFYFSAEYAIDISPSWGRPLQLPALFQKKHRPESARHAT